MFHGRIRNIERGYLGSVMKLSSITPERLGNAAKMLLLTLPALLHRKLVPNVWIITERPDQARDNGYCFYRYVREHHPEQPIYYIIDRDAPDAGKVEPYKKVIRFDSWKHFYYYNLSPIHISAHVGGCIPGNDPFARRMKKVLGIRDVFLPHGVSYGISEFCLARYAGIDLFITSGRPEYENVLKNYGYSKEQVAYTGFPRLDGWHHIKVNPKQIVLMPTWRLYVAQNPNIIFEETAYYKAYSALINSRELEDFLTAHDLKLIFYPHHEMRRYVDSFTTDCPNIEVAYRDEKYDIQGLLKESALLITDYSSVHFDFAYMGKPVLYYQFDRDEFREKQYQQADFDPAKDGFGPVAHDLSQLINDLRLCYMNGFRLQVEYEQRMKEFYMLRDERNCERVYEEIKRHFG